MTQNPMPTPGEAPPSEPTISELVATLTTLVTDLVRGEIDLFVAQLKEKGKRFGLAIGLFAGAAVLLVFMVGVLLTAAVLALALVLPGWAAALCIAGLLLLVAALLAYLGLRGVMKAKIGTPAIKSNLARDVALVTERHRQ